MNSCLYEGFVRHRRTLPVPHQFRYPVFMAYLDLAELPGLFDRRWFWSARRPAPAWFRRADYFGDPRLPLDEAVRQRVAADTGARPSGPIRLLTNLRYFGYQMNPVSIYYCLTPDGGDVEAILADITNTPWGERHGYVLSRTQAKAGGGPLRFQFGKAFHVSPFMAMDLDYDWCFSRPGRKLAVQMINRGPTGRLFDATLALRRRPMTGRSLAGVLTRYPFMTATVAAGIYWQAFHLWRKGAPFHPHPKKVRTDARSHSAG